MFRSSVVLMSLAGRASRFSRAFGPVRAHREAVFFVPEGQYGEAWNSVVEKLD